MGHPLGQSRALLHCSISLIEYHRPTDFNGTSSLSKNNISHLELIKMRWSEITDTLSSQKEPNFFFFLTGGKTPPIPVNLFTKLLALVLHDKKLKLEQRLSGILREHTKHVVIIGFHRNEWLGFFLLAPCVSSNQLFTVFLWFFSSDCSKESRQM